MQKLRLNILFHDKKNNIGCDDKAVIEVYKNNLAVCLSIDMTHQCIRKKYLQGSRGFQQEKKWKTVKKRIWIVECKSSLNQLDSSWKNSKHLCSFEWPLTTEIVIKLTSPTKLFWLTETFSLEINTKKKDFMVFTMIKQKRPTLRKSTFLWIFEEKIRIWMCLVDIFPTCWIIINQNYMRFKSETSRKCQTQMFYSQQNQEI